MFLPAMTLHQGKYRIESTRLPEFAYGAGWWYHVVLCTRDRTPFFGKIVGDTMQFSQMGGIAHRHCETLRARRPELKVGAFVVMPNHAHLLIGIAPSEHPASGARGFAPRRFGPQASGTLPAVVLAFKAGVTRDVRRAGHRDFAWQSGYYDRVVRSEREWCATAQYIADNPQMWALDRLNPESNSAGPGAPRGRYRGQP